MDDSNIDTINLIIKNKNLLKLDYFKTISKGDFKEDINDIINVDAIDYKSLMLVMIYLDTNVVIKDYLHPNILNDINYLGFDELIEKIKNLPCSYLVEKGLVDINYAIKDLMFQYKDRLVFKDFDIFNKFLEGADEENICKKNTSQYGFIHCLLDIYNDKHMDMKINLFNELISECPNLINMKCLNKKHPVMYLLNSYNKSNANFGKLNQVLETILNNSNTNLTIYDDSFEGRLYKKDVLINIAYYIYMEHDIFEPFEMLIKRNDSGINCIFRCQDAIVNGLETYHKSIPVVYYFKNMITKMNEQEENGETINLEKHYKIINVLFDNPNILVSKYDDMEFYFSFNIIKYAVINVKYYEQIPLLEKIILYYNDSHKYIEFNRELYDDDNNLLHWCVYRKDHTLTNYIIDFIIENTSYHINVLNNMDRTILFDVINEINSSVYHDKPEKTENFLNILRHIITIPNIDVNIIDVYNRTPLMISNLPIVTTILLEHDDIDIYKTNNLLLYRLNQLQKERTEKHIINSKEVHRLIFQRFYPRLYKMYFKLGLI
tara:strand:+ start:109 stop:1752 length:1644 start_codon:yes stop_codon:yes gene_type:complete